MNRRTYPANQGMMEPQAKRGKNYQIRKHIILHTTILPRVQCKYGCPCLVIMNRTSHLFLLAMLLPLRAHHRERPLTSILFLGVPGGVSVSRCCKGASTSSKSSFVSSPPHSTAGSQRQQTLRAWKLGVSGLVFLAWGAGVAICCKCSRSKSVKGVYLCLSGKLRKPTDH